MRDIVIKISDIGNVLSAAAFNALNSEMENIVTSADITLDPDGGPDTDLNMLGKTFASYANAARTYDDGGSANAYVPSLTLPSNLKDVSGLYDGLIVIFKADNTNTGASTLATESFTRPGGAALSAGDIVANQFHIAVWNDASSRFELITQRRFATADQIEAHAISDRLVSPGNLKTVEDKYYPTGMIRSAPYVEIFGYLECNGQAVSRTTYADLFTLIGTTFGVGDGSTTFNIPNITKFSPNWVDQSAPTETWRDIAVNSSNGDVWACEDVTFKIYKRTGGIGSWVDQSAPSENWSGIAVNSSNGDVWACEVGGKIYKRTGGTGSWVDQSAPTETWRDIAVNSSNGDVWACEDVTFQIYKRTGGTGSWVDQSAPTESWFGITVNSSNGDVWACEVGGNIYKRTGGVGSWVDQSAPTESWSDITVNSSNGDVWACETSSDNIYKRTGGTGSWVDQSASSENWSGITVNSSNGDVWACNFSSENIYKSELLFKEIIKT